jgi:hypothetical protein
MAYTKKFVNPHPNGWDNPSERPPITADVLQAHTDAIQAIDNYLAAGGGGEGGGGSYELPIATSTILGGVKVDGETITITADGTISTTAEGGAVRKTSDLINDGDGSGSRFVNQSELGAVALNNNYSSLDGKPTIPTKVSELANDSKFLSEIPKASTTTVGGIKVDGEILNIASDGTLIFSGGTGGESYLADLKDTNITSLTDGQYLVYNKDSGKWINKTIEVEIPNLEELSNVNIETASLINKDILAYNESTGEWENRAISTIPLNVYELADASILPDMVQNGDVLTYNSESSTWTNQAIDLGAGSRELTLAEYDALTAEQKADGTDYYITDAEEMDELLVSTSNTYSLDEKIVGRWINGKPIYQKTIECGKLPSVAKENLVVPHNVAFIDTIIDYKIFAVSDTGTITTIPYIGTGEDFINAYANLENVIITSHVVRDSYTAYATIQYTKTVDLIPKEFSYEGAYSDNSPATYTFDREMILAGIKVKCPGVKGTSGLWQPGTVTYEVQLEEDGDWVAILTDTSSTAGVWGGSSNGNFTYNREYILPKYLEVYGLRITFTGVFRVSADITITEMVS